MQVKERIRVTANRSHRALLLGAFLLGVPFASYGQKDWNAPHIVITYCSGCHGIDGNSRLPYFPKLAGLDSTYTAKKLSAFEEQSTPPVVELYSMAANVLSTRKEAANLTHEERVNMEGVAHAAKPEVVREALLWYAKQTPPRGRGANGALIAEGEKLFASGVPDQKILPCMSCHGENAEGKRPAPRLAGQNAGYIENQLEKFRKGDRRHAPEMTMVTRDLNSGQSRAVAAYLQSK
jgi:cytochrome c553